MRCTLSLFQIKCFNVVALMTINHSSPPHMTLSYRPCSSPLITNITHNYFEALTNYTNYCNHQIGKIHFYYKARESQVRLYNSFHQNTILDKSLGTLAHFCSICQGNLSVRPPPPNSMLFIVMKLSLLVSNIVRGEGGPLFQ